MAAMPACSLATSSPCRRWISANIVLNFPPSITFLPTPWVTGTCPARICPEGPAKPAGCDAEFTAGRADVFAADDVFNASRLPARLFTRASATRHLSRTSSISRCEFFSSSSSSVTRPRRVSVSVPLRGRSVRLVAFETKGGEVGSNWSLGAGDNACEDAEDAPMGWLGFVSNGLVDDTLDAACALTLEIHCLRSNSRSADSKACMANRWFSSTFSRASADSAASARSSMAFISLSISWTAISRSASSSAIPASSSFTRFASMVRSCSSSASLCDWEVYASCRSATFCRAFVMISSASL
mmetsp:Transcript_35781/g.60286  ORF Transcript_35781/g.60286 Transcript_35781/m.60286 type:complete len:299 (+) Transcript_35781:940-1836(+)